MHTLRDEIAFLFSGKGMPYEKVSILVAVVVTVVFTIFLSNNYVKDGSVAVIDLDNSRYSRELIDVLDASPYIAVNAVLNVPAEPKTLFYQDACIAVVYLPKDLEKERYGQTTASIGVFYDNTNSAQTAGLKAALNEIIALENQKIAMESGARGNSGLVLHDRILFNPVGSTCNGTTLGFLFFFSSMFFVFATIGIIPRLRLEGKLDASLEAGDLCGVLARLLPYCGCLLVALFVGMAVLRLGGDMVLQGDIFVFFFSQLLYIPLLGVTSLLFGWNAANPGSAVSRMIFFVPGGFLLGGVTSPIPILSEWVQIVSHFFPLVWEFSFVRDILLRGASFMDCAKTFGACMLYLAALIAVFCCCFFRARAQQKERGALRTNSVWKEA